MADSFQVKNVEESYTSYQYCGLLIVALSLCLDELAYSFRSMQQPSASSSTDEGMQR